VNDSTYHLKARAIDLNSNPLARATSSRVAPHPSSIVVVVVVVVVVITRNPRATSRIRVDR